MKSKFSKLALTASLVLAITTTTTTTTTQGGIYGK
jgi:hypothetical protein